MDPKLTGLPPASARVSVPKAATPSAARVNEVATREARPAAAPEKSGPLDFFDRVKDRIGDGLEKLGDVWDRHVERPFAVGNDGFVALDASGNVVNGNGVGSRVRDTDAPRSPLDPFLRLLGDAEEREVTFRFPDGSTHTSRTDKAGFEELSLEQMDGGRLTRGMDPKKGGLMQVGVSTPEGKGAQANVLVLPKDYDGPIFVCDIDDTLRHTSYTAVAKGERQPPIEGSSELLAEVAKQGIPIVYLSAGTDRINTVNRDFLSQFPPGILLDRKDFGVGEVVPWGQPQNQGAYKSEVLGQLKTTYPQAQLFGLGDDKYGDAMAYTRQGAKAYIHDVLPGNDNLPADFTGTVTKAYTPDFISKVTADLKAAVAKSASFGGAPQKTDAAAELSKKLDFLTGTRATEGNQVDLYVDGEEAFPAILEGIRSAKKSITYDTFNFLGGEKVTEQIADELIAAHKRGVKVRMVVDAMGSRDFGPIKENKTINRLQAAGVEVHVFNPVDGLNDLDIYRNHRKSIVVDGQTAFVGGMNTGDHYMGPSHHEGSKHDLFSRIRGPAVGEVARAFYDTWDEVGGSKVSAAERNPSPAPAKEGGVKTRVVAFDPTEGDETIRAAYLAMIDSARDSIHVMNSFPMADDVRDHLIAAAQRGVKVSYIVGGNEGILGAAARANFQRLLDAGADIYVYPTKVHAKTLSVDGRVATVGSANVDNVALSSNKELIAMVEDEAWVRDFDARVFQEDMRGDDHGNKTLKLPRKLDDSRWEKLAYGLLEKVWPDSLE